jgi:hypothetical protein
MSIADGMKDIVDNIEHSRTERIADVGEIRSGTQNMIHSFTKERKHNAADMRRTLRKGRKALLHETQDMLGGIHGTRMALAREIQDMLGGFSANRMAMAKDTRDTLEDFTARLKKDVAEIRLDAVNMVHGIADERVARNIELTLMLADFKKQRIPFQKDLAEAHGIWQSHMGNEHPYARPRLKTVHKATKAPGKEIVNSNQSTDHDLKEKILKLINGSPKGISLTKAGKKIGVEWRTLIRPAKELLKVGDVRKKDTYYFPS